MRELDQIGPGFPLFFYLKTYFIVIFFAIFIFVGCWSTIVNIIAGKGDQWVDRDDTSFIIKLSLGNFGKDESNYNVTEVTLQPIFHFIAIV